MLFNRKIRIPDQPVVSSLENILGFIQRMVTHQHNNSELTGAMMHTILSFSKRE